MPTQQARVVVVSVVLAVVTAGAVTIRLAHRKVLAGKLEFHDWLILMAAGFAIAMVCSLASGTIYGLGQHAVDVKPNDAKILSKIIFVTSIFYFICNMLVKNSLLFFYKDMTKRAEVRGMKNSIKIMHIVAIVFGLSSVLVTIFSCDPIAKNFDPIMPGRCIDVWAFNKANGIIMLCTDMVLYAMPMIFLSKSQMKWRGRLSVYSVVSIPGILVLAASIARISVIYTAATTKGSDLTYHFSFAMICSAVENHVAVWVACSPSLRTAYKSCFTKVSTAYNSIKSRVLSRSRSGSRSDDTDAITSLGPPFGPPMLPPVKPSPKFAQIFRPYNYLSVLNTRVANRTEVTNVALQSLDEKLHHELHPALRTSEVPLKDAISEKDLTLVEVDSVTSSTYSMPILEPAEPPAAVVRDRFFGPSPV